MNIRNAFLLLTAGALGYLVVAAYRLGALTPETAQEPASSPYRPMVEEILHQHEGEETPIAHAFEAALEEERRHEEALAKETGVHS